MLTKVTIKNFKKLESISFSLSQCVVLIGPNNSGKSTVFQALCLWEIGVKNYINGYKKNDLNRQGAVTINRKDLLNSPISDARFLWKNKKVTNRNSGGPGQIHVPLSIELEGDSNGTHWKCHAEFTFSNAESFSCKVLTGLKEVIELYESDDGIHFGFLQPMSGITTAEDKLTQGSIDRKLGEGRTAEVLRNICYDILYPETGSEDETEASWEKLSKSLKLMFGAELQKPEFLKTTGLITLEYVENGIRYDISSGGRGFQQTLLLLSYMFSHPKTILLLDEPDAHLEVIRQREVFQRINTIASENNLQIIIASHSEVVLDEASEASKVIALIENSTFELNAAANPGALRSIKKSLTEIGWEKYYLAKSKKHILFLEGTTDLQMLLSFANKLSHKVESLLRFANVNYTADNVQNTAVSNYVTLKHIFPELKGVALFDNIPDLKTNPKLEIICWQRRELENYFASPALLIKHVRLLSYQYRNFTAAQMEDAMNEAIKDFTLRGYLSDLSNEWWLTAKLSDDWLDKIIPAFYQRIGIPRDFFKRDYYKLISLMNVNEIPTEISEKLDKIYELLL